MFRRNLMSRRNVLRGAAGGLLLAPFLRQRRLEAQLANPKRMVILFTPDSLPPEWWPGGSGTSFTLNEPLADFAGLESEMLFPRRLDHSWTFDNHHEAGIVQLFTGERFFDDNARFAAGPSIDQVLLQETEIRGGTPIASIQLCVDDGRTDKRHIIAYSGANQPLTNQRDPSRAFNDIFEGVTFGGSAPASTPATSTTPTTTDTPTVDVGAQVHERILELNTEELRTIQQFLGQTEREKLEIHVESLQELQNRIAIDNPATSGGDTTGGGVEPNPEIPVGGSCEQTSTSGVQQRLNDENAITNWAQIQSDIIVNSFTCDRTRVAAYQFSFSGGHHEGLLGFNSSWHDNVAHISNPNDGTRDLFIKFARFWGGHINYLARRLAEIPEGDGTMLDNTLLYWGVESGTNHSHSPRDMQYLLIGGRNMGFQLGQFMEVSTTSAHKLHTSVLNAFGLAATGFGIEPNSGPLAGIVA